MHNTADNRLSDPRTGVLAGMIAFAVATRLVIHFAPGAVPYHFSPVEAIALFGGAQFADRRLAIGVPLVAMLIADLVIGLHELIPVVYGCLALSALLGRLLRGRAGVLPVATGAVGSSVLFFVEIGRAHV
mgnify:CR=1 FL=1